MIPAQRSKTNPSEVMPSLTKQAGKAWFKQTAPSLQVRGQKACDEEKQVNSCEDAHITICYMDICCI